MNTEKEHFGEMITDRILAEPWVILAPSGREIYQGERFTSVDCVVSQLLGYDSHNWYIIEDEGIFRLMVTRHSENAFGGNGGFAEWPDYASDSVDGVFEKVLAKREGVKGASAMPLSEWQATD